MKRLYNNENFFIRPNMKDIWFNILSTFTQNIYPNNDILINKISKSLDIPYKNILLTSGADGGIQTVFDFVLKTSRNPIKTCVQKPCFSYYNELLNNEIFELNQIEISLSNIREYNFINKTLEKIKNSQSDFYILVSPNNPLPFNYSLKELEDLVKYLSIKNPKSTILIDQTYFEFLKIKSTRDKLFLKTILENSANVFIIRSFSKGYGLAGCRIGYIISNSLNKDLIKRNLPYPINQASLLIAKNRFYNKKLLQRMQKKLNKSKRYFCKKLKSILPQESFYKSDANFITIDLGKNLNTRIYEKLLQNNIKIRFIKPQNFLRITISKKSIMKKIFNIIKEIINEQKN